MILLLYALDVRTAMPWRPFARIRLLRISWLRPLRLMPLPALPKFSWPSGVEPAGIVASPITFANTRVFVAEVSIRRPPELSEFMKSRSDVGAAPLLSLIVLAGPMIAEIPVGFGFG